jgi:Spherulation-specific family 4
MMSIVIPMYIYPFPAGSDWTRLAAPPVTTIILNPNSGPGSVVDSNYLSATSAAHAKGIQVIGYVDTNYGAIATATVESQVDTYYTWYAVDGIFFDRADNTSANVSYYTTLYSYVKAKTTGARTVVLNPGTQTIEGYMSACDLICTFEGDAATYLKSYVTNPAWIANYAATRFWHIIFGISDLPTLNTVYLNAQIRNAGCLYCSTRTLASNPYAALPTAPFWNAFSSLVQTGTTPIPAMGILTAMGPGVASLQDYSRLIDAKSIAITQQQGTQNDTLQSLLWDALSTTTVVPEDDLVVVDASDPLGFPTVNLLQNPSFEGAYNNGVAGWWGIFPGTPPTGATVASSATAKFGTTAQRMAIANVASGQSLSLLQNVTLPMDENSAVLRQSPYLFSVWIATQTAITGAIAQLFISWYTANFGAFLSSSSVQPISPYAVGYTRYWLPVIAPPTAAIAQLVIQLVTTSATNTGALLIDGAQFEYATFANSYVTATQTALQAGVYPTAFTDPALLNNGVYQDGVTNLYYRHLRLFGGFARVVHDDYSMGPERYRTLSAVDYGVRFQEAPATLVIQKQQDSTAIAQAVTYARNQDPRALEGMDTTTYVQSIALIDGHIYNWQKTKDVLDTIAAQTVASWWVDPYNRFHYTPALAISAPFGFSDQPNMTTTFPFAKFTYDADSTQALTTEVIEGSTQLSAPQSQMFNGNGSAVTFQVNNGNPIAQIDSITVGGVGQTVGLVNVNTYSQGYSVLYDPSTGAVSFATAPSNGTNNVVIVYRYAAPVLMRIRNTTATGSRGSTRRPIHNYQKIDAITSQQSAIDRANADLAQNSKARPIGTIVAKSDQCPILNQLRVGMAIPVTHRAAQFNQTLFQIQSIKTTVVGPGIIQREIGIGFYRPDFIIQLAQARAEELRADTSSTTTVLNDVQTAGPDGWTLTDSASATVANIGTWGPGTSSTWNSTFVWG